MTSEDIAGVISKMTGIPVNNLLKGEKDKLLDMNILLRQSVVGQDEAIDAVSDAVRLQRAGLTSENRPIASFMFWVLLVQENGIDKIISTILV